jgi:uncharacterized protein (TIGR01777 family)
MIERNKIKFLITGGTGFIGSKLVDRILSLENSVTVLTRKANLKSSKNLQYINKIGEEFDYDIVINLCGEPISCRWSKLKKQKISTSRIDLTKDLVEKILNSKTPPKLFISGSAIGYYGTSKTNIFYEDSQPTNQNLFSQKLCFDWEFEAQKVNKKTRVVLLRTGVVIGAKGGIIKKMLPPFKMFAGGKIGSGKQSISWIHIDDAINAILHIIHHQNIVGAVNLTSPNPASNLQFSQELAKAIHRPCIFTIPALIMKIIYGRMAEELLLNGQKVYPKTLLKSGYSFKFTELKSAIEDCFI